MTDDVAPSATPYPGLSSWRSIKVVEAGEIAEIVSAGCYVRTAREGETVLLTYPDDKMTVRYEPKVGDFWVIYPDGYQAISPREPFVDGYIQKDSLS